MFSKPLAFGLLALSCVTAAVPPPAPVIPPITAPLPPPRMPPRTAPTTAPPPIFLALSPDGDSPSRQIGSVFSRTSVPSARTSVWNRIPSRAVSLILPPRFTNITEPIAREPAGIATRPST